jgi:hypothetical protein
VKLDLSFATGMAEDLVLYEVDSAQLTRANLTNNKKWDEVRNSEVAQPTKHTLSSYAPTTTSPIPTEQFGRERDRW